MCRLRAPQATGVLTNYKTVVSSVHQSFIGGGSWSDLNHALTPEALKRQRMNEDQKAEAEYIKSLTDAGVDVPEIPKSEPEHVEEPKKEPEQEPESPKGEEEPEKQPLPEQPKEPRKRSVYQDLKETRKEKKTLAEENEELKRQLESFKSDNEDDEDDKPKTLLEFAAERGADPELVEQIVRAAREGIPTNEIDPSLKKDLEDFKKWTAQNAQVMEKQLFNEEFATVTPTLRELFPTATDENLAAMKPVLDKLSHSQEMHDKELGYVAFKYRSELGAFVSPKKRGMEERGKGPDHDETASEVDYDNLDYSKMNASQRAQFEKDYAGAVDKEKGMVKQGKRLIMG